MKKKEIKKSIFVAFDAPIPKTGGGTRAYHLANALASATECNLIILQKKCDIPEELSQKCKIIRFYDKIRKSPNTKLEFLRLLFFPWSYSFHSIVLSAQYYIHVDLQKVSGKSQKLMYLILKYMLAYYVFMIYRFFKLAPARAYERYDECMELMPEIEKALKDQTDILWLEFTPVIYYFKKVKKKFPDLKLIVNAHNVEYIYHERLMLNLKDKIQKKWHSIQAKAMKSLETKYLHIVDNLMVCSETDKDVFAKYISVQKIEVIPNGVDTLYFSPKEELSSYPSILFTGNMNYLPNAEAIEYFITNIWPQVLNSNKDIRFMIAGMDAERLARKYNKIQNLEFYNSPADMRPIYNKAWLVVVPLLSGSGTRLKILEAMAMNKPVISTSLAAEGIEVKNNQDIIMINKDVEFASAICSILQNQIMANELSYNGRNLVITNYDWKISKDKCKNLLSNL